MKKNYVLLLYQETLKLQLNGEYVFGMIGLLIGVVQQLSDTGDGIAPVTTPLLDMTADLNYWMRKLVLEVRKKDGSMHPPYALVCCFKCYYEANGVHDINPLDASDTRFGSFRAVLGAEMKQLHSLGLGATSKQAEPVPVPITSDDEALLWSTGQLGVHA